MAKTADGLRVLIVDDEKSVRRFLKASLRSQGYRIFEAATGRSALESLTKDRPDLVILDLGLPDQDGVLVTREIRSRSQIPIIIVSVREQESDKIAALDSGADDYLSKPFSAGELSARLRAVIRRWLPQNDGPVFKTRELRFDIVKRQVKVREQLIRLTPTEFDVLKLLVLKAGKVVTHKQFFQEVWNKDESLEKIDHLLRVTISNLRNKLELNPAQPAYVLTEAGIGYRLSME